MNAKLLKQSKLIQAKSLQFKLKEVNLFRVQKIQKLL